MGAFQSPINIGKTIASPELRSPDFRYFPTSYKLSYNGQYISAVPSDVMKVVFEQQTYMVDRIVFHTPSEHKVKSDPYDGEIQIQHRNERGERLFISILVLEGSRLKAFDVLKDRIPRRVGAKRTLVGWDLRRLLPRKRRYYRYVGSMSKPPCTEGVTWLVFQKPIQMSGYQLDVLEKVQGKNSRPIQNIGNRIPLRSR